MGWQEREDAKAVAVGDDTAKGQRAHITGLLTAVREGQGKKKNSRVYTLTEEDGTQTNVWGSVTIDDKLSVVDIGAIVDLKFVERVTPPGGSEYKLIKVRVYSVEPGETVSDRVAKWPGWAALNNGKTSDNEEPPVGDEPEDDQDLPF
jgi:hypothetical protein